MANKWIQKATESIKRRGTAGKCTPISKPSCTGRARTLALTFKKMARARKKHDDGGYLDFDTYLQVHHDNCPECAQKYMDDGGKLDVYEDGGTLYVRQFSDGGSIYIKPSKRGTFTAAATKHNMGVQEFASHVLGNKEDYSTAMIKKANFARNAAKWKHELGGALMNIHNEDEMMKCLGGIMKHALGGEMTNQQMGQTIGNTIGQVSNLLLPGAGAIVSPILSTLGAAVGKKGDELQVIRDHLNTIKTSTNPYGYALGGALQGAEDLFEYIGNSHKNGGIGVATNGLPDKNGDNEVEGEETAYRIGGKTFIFSKKLKI